MLNQNGSESLRDYIHKAGLSISDLDLCNSDFLSKESSLYVRCLIAIWNTLHEIPFYGIHLNGGRFYHLGTSEELQQLQLMAFLCSDDKDVTMDNYVWGDDRKLLQQKQQKSKRVSDLELKDKYNLKSSIRSVVHQQSTTDYQNISLDRVVLINSALCMTSDSCIGENVIIDNSILQGRCVIGSDCVISNIGSFFRRDINLPSNIIVQEVHLGEQTGCESHRALVVLGRNDSIKAQLSDKGK